MLLVFLRVRVYYGVKLIRLGGVFYSYSLIDKHYLGIWRVVAMTRVIVVIINLYLRLILRLSLEIISFKMIIYFFILVFLVARVLPRVHGKLHVYDKIKNLKEV